MRCCDDHLLHSLHARSTPDRRLRALCDDLAADYRAVRWRAGGVLPAEGRSNNFALALIEFDSLAAYERYRETLRTDPEARENFDHAMRTQCIQVEDRCFLRRV
jgi:hypothetical protein